MSTSDLCCPAEGRRKPPAGGTQPARGAPNAVSKQKPVSKTEADAEGEVKKELETLRAQTYGPANASATNPKLIVAQEVCCRDLAKITLTVPSANPVLFAIFLAPIPACSLSERTVRIVSSGSGGLPSLLLFARATLSPAIVRSDILARSCFASVANIEIITSLNGPVESSHCSW